MRGTVQAARIERVNYRNGYRQRRQAPALGWLSWRSRSCWRARISRSDCWSAAAAPSRRWFSAVATSYLLLVPTYRERRSGPAQSGSSPIRPTRATGRAMPFIGVAIYVCWRTRSGGTGGPVTHSSTVEPLKEARDGSG